MQKSSYESDRGIPASVWTPLHPFTRSSLVKKNTNMYTQHAHLAQHTMWFWIFCSVAKYIHHKAFYFLFL